MTKYHFLIMTQNYCFFIDVSSCKSCKEIKKVCPNCQSGEYSILVGQDKLRVSCDMITDGGNQIT